MRDFSYPHEDMPTNTDREFVEMVRVATVTGYWSSTWMPRLVKIAERGAATPATKTKGWRWPWVKAGS